MAGQEDPVQREIHQDWANREYINHNEKIEYIEARVTKGETLT
uniref:Uncharacterized protein n=1 Tax=Oryzias sinensis TaxID=183150 RepID=A0A8C7X0R9_9TELE